jgi:xylulokinase
MQAMQIPISQIRASGGGARSQFWRQLQADIYRMPIVTINAAEGPAYGAALLAGVGAGVWSTVEQAAACCIKETSKLNPTRKLAELYDRSYAVYSKLYGDLKERFAEMGAE